MIERLFQKRLQIGRVIAMTNEGVMIMFDVYYRVNEPIVAQPSHDFMMPNPADYAALRWLMEEVWMKCEKYIESKRNKGDDMKSALKADQWFVVGEEEEIGADD